MRPFEHTENLNVDTLSIISDKIDIPPSNCSRRVGGLQNARSVTKVLVNTQERKENRKRHRVFLRLILEQFKTVTMSMDRQKPVMSGQENKGKVCMRRGNVSGIC